MAMACKVYTSFSFSLPTCCASCLFISIRDSSKSSKYSRSEFFRLLQLPIYFTYKCPSCTKYSLQIYRFGFICLKNSRYKVSEDTGASRVGRVNIIISKCLVLSSQESKKLTFFPVSSKIGHINVKNYGKTRLRQVLIFMQC